MDNTEVKLNRWYLVEYDTLSVMIVRPTKRSLSIESVLICDYLNNGGEVEIGTSNLYEHRYTDLLTEEALVSHLLKNEITSTVFRAGIKLIREECQPQTD